MSNGFNESKVVIVTGVGGGIDREIVLALADSGVWTVISDIDVSLQGGGRSASPAKEIPGLICQRGGEGLINTGNVADWNSARRIVECAMDGFGHLDIAVNDAGILHDAIFHKTSADGWLSVINIHLNGNFFVSRVVAERFRAQQAGVFVHMTSTSGLIGNFGQAGCFAAKLGIVALSKSTALDMRRHNARSSYIAPFVWSRMINSIPVETPGQRARADKLQRITPEKNAPLAVYPASDAVREVIGQVFAACHHELLPISQSRPLRSVYSRRDWIPGNIAEHGMPALRSSFMDLACSPDVPSWDPV